MSTKKAIRVLPTSRVGPKVEGPQVQVCRSRSSLALDNIVNLVELVLTYAAFHGPPEQDHPIYKYPLQVSGKEGCYFPFKFDTTLAGPCHRCRYCYREPLMRFVYKTREALFGGTKYATSLDAALERASTGRRGKNSAMFQAGLPLKWGGMSDPFPPDPVALRLALQSLDALVRYGAPFILVTKSAVPMIPRVVDLLGRARDRCQVQISLAWMDNQRAREFEPGAPSPRRRLRVIETLLNNGIDVVLRVAPIIIGVNSGDVVNLMDQFLALGGKKVIIEELRCDRPFRQYLEDRYPDAAALLSEKRIRNYYRYPESTVEPLFREYRDHAQRLGLRLGICSNAVLEQRLNSNENCCLVDFTGCRVDPAAGRVVDGSKHNVLRDGRSGGAA